MNAESHFEQFLDSLIADELASGTVTWSDLLRRLPGVTPDIVLDSLRRRQLLARIDFNNRIQDAEAATLPVAFRLWGEGMLPTPHPLDACWWFSDPSLAVLTSRIEESTAGKVVLLGTPTLWHVLRTDRSRFDSVKLLDGDRRIRNQGAGDDVVICDVLRDELPRGFDADLVMADPPWYETEMQHFLVAAREFCKINGQVLLSVPPEGTRPGIENEWQRLLQWASGLGFELVSYETAVLSYLSPPFEHNAFLSAGAHPVHTDWRHGDLATFVRTSRGVRPCKVVPQRETWIDYTIDGVRFRLRSPCNDTILGVPDLFPLVLGDVLPSVSRRHPLRNCVDLWSSGNRVFRCSQRLVMMLILGALENGTDPISVVEHKVHRKMCIDDESQLARIVAKLRHVIEVEKCENLAFRQRYERPLDSSPN